jgi:hypothetical protein
MADEIKNPALTQALDAAEMNKRYAAIQDSTSLILAKLNDSGKKEVAVEVVEKGPLEDNMFGKIADMKVFDIPIGAAAFGLLASGIGDGVSGLVQGMLPANATVQKYGPPAIKLGLAFVTAKYGKKLVGPTAANLGAFVFTMDAIQDIVDIRGLVSGLFPKKTATTAGARAVSRPIAQGAIANSGTGGYYNSAFGRN